MPEDTKFCPVVDNNDRLIETFLTSHPNLLRDLKRFKPGLVEDLTRKYGESVAKKIMEKAIDKTIGKAIDATTKPLGLFGAAYKKYLGVGQALLKDGALSGTEAIMATERLQRFKGFVLDVEKLKTSIEQEGVGREYSLYDLLMTCSERKKNSQFDFELRMHLDWQNRTIAKEIIPALDDSLEELDDHIVPYYTEMFQSLHKKFNKQFPEGNGGNLIGQARRGMKLTAWSTITTETNDIDTNYYMNRLTAHISKLYDHRNEWARVFGNIARRTFNREKCERLKKAQEDFLGGVNDVIGQVGQRFGY